MLALFETMQFLEEASYIHIVPDMFGRPLYNKQNIARLKLMTTISKNGLRIQAKNGSLSCGGFGSHYIKKKT